MFPWGPGPRYAALACLLLAGCGDGGLGASKPSSPSGTGGGPNGTGGSGFDFGEQLDSTNDACGAGLGGAELGGAPNQAILAPQAVAFTRPHARIFYTWTSSENEDALREGEDLLSVGEHPELGRGGAMELLHAAASGDGASLTTKALASVYRKYRYAWPNPWATRMGWPGETYGDRLVRIELSENAWIAVLGESGAIADAYDLEGNSISLESVAANPERVGAIYFKHASDLCGFGTFRVGGSGAYREFILGSPSMIASLSIGTDEIHERIAGDIDALEEYLAEVRRNGSGFESSGTFDEDLYCAWATTCDSYLLGLAIGSEYYRPTPANLLALLDTLNAFDFGAEPYERKGP